MNDLHTQTTKRAVLDYAPTLYTIYYYVMRFTMREMNEK